MSIFANRSLRLKVALPALIAMLALLATLGAALLALRSADRGAEGLYQRSAKALAALGDVRDGEGDSRVDALTLARVTDPGGHPRCAKGHRGSERHDHGRPRRIREGRGTDR